jgi:hypothetical protein
MHLRIGRSTGNGAYMQMGPVLRVMMACKSIVSFDLVFDQIAAPVPEIMDGGRPKTC